MIATIATTVLAGVGLVARAPHDPARLALLERAGGLLLCAGLMSVGVGLAHIVR